MRQSSNFDTLYNQLYRTRGKAEIINGKIVEMSPTGWWPGYASGEIFASLRSYVKRTGKGHAIPDNIGFKVNLPHRKSFSPDAAFYTGNPQGMKFLEGAPSFAAEVRSESDYGEKKAIAQKRSDYFLAGTLVFWDVDLLDEEVVKAYRASKPNIPTIYKKGQLAEAEPAVPGWQMPVDNLLSH